MHTQYIMFDDNHLWGGGTHHILPGAWARQQVEYATAGLDGVVSLDLGRRSRQIRQTGRLTAETLGKLHEMIDTIESYANGQTYELIDQDGRRYRNVRLDMFRQKEPVQRAAFFSCEYEILYTQSAS